MRKMNTLGCPQPVTVDLSFKQMSKAELDRLFKPFYLGLPCDARRVRFGYALSDDALGRYCDRFLAGKALGFGCLSGTGLLALVEFHPFGDKGELAFASAASEDGPSQYRRLLLLAAVAARGLGCRSLVVAPDLIDPQVPRLLREMGDLGREPATGFLELRGFAQGETRFAAMQAGHA